MTNVHSSFEAKDTDLEQTLHTPSSTIATHSATSTYSTVSVTVIGCKSRSALRSCIWEGRDYWRGLDSMQRKKLPFFESLLMKFKASPPFWGENLSYVY